MTQWIWLDANSWFPLPDEDGETFEGQWQELHALVAGLEEHTVLLVSPRLVLCIRAEAGSGANPTELAESRLGLKPGSWRYHTRLAGDQFHLAACSPEVESLLESLQAAAPQNLDIVLAPLKTAPHCPEAVVFEGNDLDLLLERDQDGLVTSWHWVTPAFCGDTPRLGLEQIPELLPSRNWHIWQGPARSSYRFMARTARFLAVAAIVMVISSLLLAWRWSVTGPLLEERRLQAAAYLAEHRREAELIGNVKERGEFAWKKLEEIQAFSNRESPVANALTELANLGTPQVAWRHCRWKEREFSLVLSGPRMPLILDVVDGIRALEGVEQVRFEELESGVVGDSFEVKIEGRYK